MLWIILTEKSMGARKFENHVLFRMTYIHNHYSAKSVQRLRKTLHLKGTVQEAASFKTLEKVYDVIRERFPRMGARQMVTTIRQDYSIKVSECVNSWFIGSKKKLIQFL